MLGRLFKSLVAVSKSIDWENTKKNTDSNSNTERKGSSDECSNCGHHFKDHEYSPSTGTRPCCHMTCYCSDFR